MKLCINPNCFYHCDIEKKDGVWVFGKDTPQNDVWMWSGGFRCQLDKDQLANLDVESEENLCRSCQCVINLLVARQLLPPIPKE